jgi:hypothetical protein
MKTGGIDFFTHVCWWSYIFGGVIEFLLMLEPYFDQSKIGFVVVDDHKAPSIDMDEIEMGKENELEKRVTSLKKMKSAVVKEKSSLTPANNQAYDKVNRA